MHAITVDGLVKKYGSKVAVDNVSFSVVRGETFAFLGTNGAGKSTVIGCITTTHSFDKGKITVNGLVVGKDNDEMRRQIGVVFQTSLLDELLTVRENLKSRAAFYDLTTEETTVRITELAKTLHITPFLDQRYGTLSGGQKRRTDIARALIHRPDILFLDEPTAGLDPASREQVWQTIAQLQKDTDLTVFLTTHYMEETEQANKVYIIDKGKVIANGTPSTLRANYTKDQLRLTPNDMQQLRLALREAQLIYTEKDAVLQVAVASSAVALEFLIKHKKNIADFEFVHGTMDDAFLGLTNQTTRRGDTT